MNSKINIEKKISFVHFIVVAVRSAIIDLCCHPEFYQFLDLLSTNYLILNSMN